MTLANFYFLIAIMPELPEVENVKRSLTSMIINQKIISIDIFYEKIISKKGNFNLLNNLLNKKILKINRIAKNLIIEVESNLYLLVHLKMTGKLLYYRKNSNDFMYHKTKHDHIIFNLENGYLIYNDVRKFGYIGIFDSKSELFSLFETIGIDSFDNFDKDVFIKSVKKSKGNLKKVFLEQKVVSGLGNIYSDEVLFDSKINPNRKVETLTNSEINDLYQSITVIIQNAVTHGGSSISDYVMADGKRGSYSQFHKVYKRGGKECLICGFILTKTKIASRTTVYCSICQK